MFNVFLKKSKMMIVTLSSMLFLVGCGGGDENESTSENCTIEGKNEFLYNYMKDKYLWYQNVPDLDYRKYQNSEDLLEALIYKKYDRWSYIWEDIEITNEDGSTDTIDSHDSYYNEGKTYGTFGVQLTYLGDEVYVQYVFRDSPAYRAGLKRGVEILEVNDKTIQEISDNDLWDEILGEDSGEIEHKFKVRIDGNIKILTMNKNTVIQNSVLNSKIIEQNGKKIGYFIYQSFIDASIPEINRVFEQFKTADIDELIVDLRYNGGGKLHMAEWIASLIGGYNVEGKIFETTLYNDKHSHLNYTMKFESWENHLNLNRVYIIVTENTASASESVINGLLPFIDVYLVGTTTNGKPVGMMPQKYCNMTISAINFQGINANGYGDYFDGFAPSCTSYDDVMHNFGDINEKMLSDTLYLINNQLCPPTERLLNKKSRKIFTKGYRYEVGSI